MSAIASLGLPTNTSFLASEPGLQFAWDSTSLGALKTCPRYYQYTIVQGYTPRAESVHLVFGLHYHAALERYDHARSAGEDFTSAMHKAVRYCLEATWNRALRRPWQSDHKNKNRYTLVRSVVWYLDQFEEDPFHTIQLANGKPAVELSFRYQTSHTLRSGDPVMYCGHLDRLAEFNGDIYILDRKTTTATMDQSFFDKFSPDNQFTGYVMGGQVVYSIPIKGIVVDGAQIAVTFSRFQRGTVYRHPEVLEEWNRDMGYWLAMAQVFAKAQHWPQNEKSCGNYGGCAFRNVCSKPQAVREQWLKVDFTRRVWDPLVARGDI